MSEDDTGRYNDRIPIGEIFGQLRQINDRLARLETRHEERMIEHERRLGNLEEAPGKILAAAGTISLICSGILTGLIWMFGKGSK